MILKKIYHKKESLLVWYLLLAFMVGVLIFGYLLIQYFAWQVIPLMVLSVGKIRSLTKNNSSPVIMLNDDGIALIRPNKENAFYPYSEIQKIKMNSKLKNGYIKLKNVKKEIIIDSVAIDIADQKEIVDLVNSKIEKHV